MHDQYGKHLTIASEPEAIRAFIQHKEIELRSSTRAVGVDTSEREALCREDIAECQALLTAQGN